MSNSISRPSWKQCAMLLILLSHAVFGSPIVSSPSSYTALSSGVQLTLNEVKPHTSLEEDVFGPELNGRSDRKKRLFYDTVKKAKQAKLLTIGAASSGAVKSIGKSLLKSIATFGIKAIIFNFLYSKINQVLDFKTRLLNNLEHKNKEQNSQYLGAPDSNTASSTISNSTELPAEKIPEFNAEKVSLEVPDTVIGPAFNIANGISRVLGTLIQNTATRVATLFDALKPLLRASAGFKSKKRETEFDLNNFDEQKTSVSDEFTKLDKNTAEKTPVKSSFVALTQQK